MQRETIENILNFLKEKEGKEVPDKWKLIKELETHPDGTQYRYDGMLDLSNTNITKLPNDLYVRGSLRLTACKQITKLPDKLYVTGYLDLSNCKQLTELPNNLYVRHTFWLDDSNIAEIPDNLYVGGSLFITNTPLANNYTDDEIIEMIDSKDGILIGHIRKYT